jgi:serine/threonine-protein kinase
MGVVHEGRDKNTGDRVAIKFLHPEISKHREVTLRFINEARAVTIIGHPNLVRIIHLGRQESGAPYLVMEYLDGVPLHVRLRESGGRLPLMQALDVCHQVAEALSASHEKSIVHRDLKPENIMLLADPQGGTLVKVFDFGIAKLPPEHMSKEFTMLRTQSGQLLGTPHYMAPEQCRSDRSVSDKTDVYALACVLFRCLAGRTPFVTEARGDAALMHICAQQIGEPPPLLNALAPDVPQALSKLVATALSKEPAERPTMREFSSRLAHIMKAPADGDETGSLSTRVLNKGSDPTAPFRRDQAPTVTGGMKAKMKTRGGSRRVAYIAAGIFALVWLAVLSLWALA